MNNKMKRLILPIATVCILLFSLVSYSQPSSFPFLKVGNTFVYEYFNGEKKVYFSYTILSKDKNGFYAYRTTLNGIQSPVINYYYADAKLFSNTNGGPSDPKILTLYTVDCKPGDSWQIMVNKEDDEQEPEDYGIFKTTILSVDETVSTSGGTFENCIHVKETHLNEARFYVDYYIDRNKGIIKIEASGSYTVDGEKTFFPTTYQLPGDAGNATISIAGCGSLVVGESTLLPVSYQPEGGKVRYWTQGTGITVSDGSGGALVKATEPGEGSMWAEYTTKDGDKVKESKSITSLRLISINGGDPLQIGLYNAKGRPLKAIKTVPIIIEPAGKSEELIYRATDMAIVSAIPSGDNSLTVQAVQKGKTTVQAYSECGTNTGPPFHVEIRNCDDEVIMELKRQVSQLKARLSSNLHQQNELLTNDDFMEADKNGVKAIEDVASGLQDVAITMYTPNGKGETIFKEALKIQSDFKSLQGNLEGQNHALTTWQVANMVAPESKAKEVSSAIKTFTELATATANLGAYLGTAFGVAGQLAELTEQYDKTQKELFEVQRIMYEVCGKDEVNPKGDPDDKEGDEQVKEDSEKQPKSDPKKNDPKPNQKNQPEAKDVPANQPEPTTSKTGNDVPDKASPEQQDQTSKADNPSSEPKTYSVGVDLEPEEECGCAPNLNSTIMLSPENSKDTDDALKLMIGINDVRQCYDNFLQSTLHPLLEKLKQLEAFYAELKLFSKVDEKEREKELEKLKKSILGLELDNGQKQLFQVEEFRFASSGCGFQIKDKIHTGFKMK